MERKLGLTVAILGIALALGACSKTKEKETAASSSTVGNTVESSKAPVELVVFGPTYNVENGTYAVKGSAETGSEVSVTLDGKEIAKGNAKEERFAFDLPLSDSQEDFFTVVVTNGTYSEKVDIKTKKYLADLQAKKDADDEARRKADAEARKKAEEEAADAQKKADEDAAAAEAQRKQQAADQAAAELASYDTGVTFENLARNPDTYLMTKVKFTGRIVQVIKGDDYSQYRLAVDDDYDKIIYLEISDDQLSNNRLLEDDNITIRGVSYGEMTYESAMGGDITVPSVVVDSFTLN